MATKAKSKASSKSSDGTKRNVASSRVAVPTKRAKILVKSANAAASAAKTAKRNDDKKG